jgi:galactose mutarotase-like enzyme
MNSLQPARWHNWPAWALENEALRVVIVPELGAKIVSVFDRQANYEWLVGPMRPLQPVAYGASFVEQDMSGWDEMFPTIVACDYPAPGPFQGRPLPDHGEVWSLPWTCEASESASLTCRVAGRALPYHLQRTARLAAASELQLEYTVENTGAEPFHWLWAAHPQFTAEADTVIVLPEGVTEVCNVVEAPPWGQGGAVYAWPNAITPDGARWQLDRVGPASRHDCRKFYVPPDRPVSWGKLVNQRAGSSLRLAWPVEQLPYLGIWVDEGTYNAAPTAALEPANGFYDSLARAFNGGRAALLAPGQSHLWTLTVTVTRP